MKEYNNKLNPLARFSAKINNGKSVNGNTIFPIASISKSFTGLTTALMILENKKIFSKGIDTDLKTILKNRKRDSSNSNSTVEKNKAIDMFLGLFEEDGNGKIIGSITLKELLNHTSPLFNIFVPGDDEICMEFFTFYDKYSIYTEKTKEKILKESPSAAAVDVEKRFAKNDSKICDANYTLFIYALRWAVNPKRLNERKFSYNNFGYQLIGVIMGLVSDKFNFAEEIVDRISKPLGLEKKILPYYMVLFKDRATFAKTTASGEENESIFITGNSILLDIASGGMCATMNALAIYADNISRLYLGQENSICDIEKSKEIKKMFESDMVKSDEKQYEASFYSFGIYKNIIDNNRFNFFHKGGLWTIRSFLNIKIENEGVSDIEASVTWEDFYLKKLFSELIGDGVKYTDEQLIAIKERIFNKTSADLNSNTLNSPNIDLIRGYLYKNVAEARERSEKLRDYFTVNSELQIQYEISRINYKNAESSFIKGNKSFSSDFINGIL